MQTLLNSLTEFANSKLQNILSLINENHYQTICLAVIFFCCMPSLQGQSPLTKLIDLELKNASVADALIDLSEIADINIAFHPKLFSDEQKVNLAIKDKSVAYVLKQCLKGTNVTFKLDGSHLILYQKPITYYTISGYMEDAISGERLVAATIWDVISGKGSTTNDYGFFSLKVPKGKVELHASYIGYQSSVKSLEVSKTQQIALALKPSITLSEVIVIATDTEESQAQINLGKGEAAVLNKLGTTLSLGGEPDLLRHLSGGMGVQSGADGFGGLQVRGGSADQNLVLLDGVPIYNPSHTLGMFSIFNTHIVKSAHLVKDGFSAKYGGRLSSVIDVRVKEGSTKEWKGEAEIGTLATKLIVEGPIKKDKSGLLVALRRTHIDPFLTNYSQNKKDYAGESNYYFFDINAKLHYRLSTKDQLFLSFYKGKDAYRDEDIYEWESEEDDDVYEYYYEKRYQNTNWGNNIASFRWNHLFGDRLFSNTTLTYSHYNYKSFNADYDEEQYEEELLKDYYFTVFQSKIKDLGLKIDLEYYPAPHHQILFGGGLLARSFESGELESYTKYELSESIDLEAIYEVSDTLYDPPLLKTTEINFYVEDKIALSKQLSLMAGLHLAAFKTANKTFIAPQPRFAFYWKVLPPWTMTLSASRMTQFLHILSASGSSLPNDLWVPSTENVGPQSSWQFAWNTTYKMEQGWKLNFELFYKNLDNLLSYEDTEGLPSLQEYNPIDWEAQITIGKGKSYGFGGSVERGKGKTTGHASYGYTVSERQFEDVNEGIAYPFRFTHTHEFKIGLQHQFNKTIALNIAWHYGSGQPISLISTDSRFAPLQNLSDTYTERIGAVNSYLLPAYHKLDIGCHFNWRTPRLEQHLNVGLYNIYNRKNPYYIYLYDDEYFPEEKGLKQQNALPLIPSVGYRVVF